jgi:GT2 family glycosyltransferase
MPAVSIIIVHYNTFDITLNCIRSILKWCDGLPIEIIVVDNASTDRNSSELLEWCPDIILLRSDKNLGFAGGNNLGLTKATGDYILLLNSDTILFENSIRKAYEYAATIPDLGVLGCRMTYVDGRLQFTARRFKTIRWEVLDMVRPFLYLGTYRWRSRTLLGKYFRHDESIECDWLNGAFLLFPKHIIDEMPNGALDARFFIYGEDELWCWQVKRQDKKVIFYCGTTIIHLENKSTPMDKREALAALLRDRALELIQIQHQNDLYFRIYKFIFLLKDWFRKFLSRLFSLQ